MTRARLRDRYMSVEITADIYPEYSDWHSHIMKMLD